MLTPKRVLRRGRALIRVFRSRLGVRIRRLKRQHLTIGGRGENIAARWLQRKGYIIIQRNWRTKLGEVDLIAIDQRTLVFIEVKTRKKMHAKRFPAELSINQKKIDKLRLLAGQYTNSHLRFLYRDRIAQLRFDTIGVYYEKVLGDRYLKAEIEHLPGAF